MLPGLLQLRIFCSCGDEERSVRIGVIPKREEVLVCGAGFCGLARAYALQGDTAKARAVYDDFFTLWKAPDPDIPS
jgi:ATP/maltotriose-dependent transcriptional regulator MalT